MRGSSLGAAAVMALVGLIWVGQGVGLVKGSFMTGDPKWAVIGAVLLVAAAVVAGVALRRRLPD